MYWNVHWDERIFTLEQNDTVYLSLSLFGFIVLASSQADRGWILFGHSQHHRFGRPLSFTPLNQTSHLYRNHFLGVKNDDDGDDIYDCDLLATL